MDRAVASGATGRRFESCQAYQPISRCLIELDYFLSLQASLPREHLRTIEPRRRAREGIRPPHGRQGELRHQRAPMVVLGWWCRSGRLRSQTALAYFTLFFELPAHPPRWIAPMEPPLWSDLCAGLQWRMAWNLLRFSARGPCRLPRGAHDNRYHPKAAP